MINNWTWITISVTTLNFPGKTKIKQQENFFFVCLYGKCMKIHENTWKCSATFVLVCKIENGL